MHLPVQNSSFVSLQVWTSVGACLFAVSTLVNAGLAMVLLVNLRPGYNSFLENEVYPYGSENPDVRRRPGHSGFTPFLLITLSNLATNILDSLLLLLAAGLFSYKPLSDITSLRERE